MKRKNLKALNKNNTPNQISKQTKKRKIQNKIAAIKRSQSCSRTEEYENYHSTSSNCSFNDDDDGIDDDYNNNNFEGNK